MHPIALCPQMRMCLHQVRLGSRFSKWRQHPQPARASTGTTASPPLPSVRPLLYRTVSPLGLSTAQEQRDPHASLLQTSSTRASHGPFSQSQSQSQSQGQAQAPPPSTTHLARLSDKKKEVEAVEALQRASTLFLRRLEGLADDCEAMADAGFGACMYRIRAARCPSSIIHHHHHHHF
jgi:hypothetical protein